MDPDLKQRLESLHAELDRLHGGEPLDEARLLELVNEVEERLAPPDPQTAEPPEGLLDNLRHWAEAFELEHPTLASVVNRIMQSLGGTGI